MQETCKIDILWYTCPCNSRWWREEENFWRTCPSGDLATLYQQQFLGMRKEGAHANTPFSYFPCGPSSGVPILLIPMSWGGPGRDSRFPISTLWIKAPADFPFQPWDTRPWSVDGSASQVIICLCFNNSEISFLVSRLGCGPLNTAALDGRSLAETSGTCFPTRTFIFG